MSRIKIIALDYLAEGVISPAYSKQTAKIRRVPHVYFIAPDAILKEAAAWWSVDEWSEEEGGDAGF